jgi:hypothetical protein
VPDHIKAQMRDQGIEELQSFDSLVIMEKKEVQGG